MTREIPEAPTAPIGFASVVTLTYDRIRAQILDGSLPPGTRLAQVEISKNLGVSRTPVREALRRLTGEGLVEAEENRGFRVATLALDDVVRRLEARLIVEPGIARLASERATAEQLAAIEETIVREREAKTAVEVHDASRSFHVMLATATLNAHLVQLFEGLWLVEVGRRLLTRRQAVPLWQHNDVAEHAEILAAVAAEDGAAAATLMERHLSSALQHWQPDEPVEPDDGD